jgi:6-phosphogluconolactonase
MLAAVRIMPAYDFQSSNKPRQAQCSAARVKSARPFVRVTTITDGRGSAARCVVRGAAMKASALPISLLVFLSACGGGGSGSGTTTPVTNEKLGGIWTTSYVVTSGPNMGDTIDGFIVSTDSGEYFSVGKNLTNGCESLGTGTATDVGTAVTVNGSGFIATFGLPPPPSCTFPDGSTAGTLTATATISAGVSFTVTAESVTTTLGTVYPGTQLPLKSNFNSLYSEGSSFNKIAGNYTVNVPNGAPLTVHQDGSFGYTDRTGCSASGNFGIINSANSVMSVSLSANNCGILSGNNLTGLAFLNDAVSPAILVVFVYTSRNQFGNPVELYLAFVQTSLPSVSVPNVVGLPQAAASTAITGAGLTVGTVTMASNASVASGSVVSEIPAPGAQVAVGSAVNLTVSTGPAGPGTVAVPNVVGMTQAAASTAITAAGLKVGTVTMASSNTVASGSVISESPVAATKVAAGSSVNLTVSTGPANQFAYASNHGDGTLSGYSLNSSTGALTALASSPITVTGASQLDEIRFDPLGKFLYVTSHAVTQGIYAFSVSATDGTLTALLGSPFTTGNGPQSITFDASGAYLYVANVADNTISAYSLTAATGVLTPLAGSPYAITGTNPAPAQLARAGNYLYVADTNTSSVDVFAINPATGALTEGVTGSPFATDTGPFTIVVDPAGTVLYTGNTGAAGASISGFSINSTTGVLTPITGSPQLVAVNNDIGIDPQGKFLFVTEGNTTGLVAVYPIDVTQPGGLGAQPAGSPFAAGNAPNSISFDPSGKFAYVGDDGGNNVSEFSLDGTTGVLTLNGSVATGMGPDFIAIN